MRITVNGERAETAIKRSIDPNLWNETKGCPKSGYPFAEELNQYLNQIRHQIYQYQQDLVDKNLPVTALSLKKRIPESKR
jgi:hypothetical protein